jgi:hypothetical protein
MAVVAEVLCSLQAGSAVFLEETQKVFALHEVHLARLDGFGGELVVGAIRKFRTWRW